MKDYLGVGIAGNFAEHLSEAGEDKDFVNIHTDDPGAPKGIFPFYVPNHQGILGINPICETELKMPQIDSDAKLQAEPEMAIKCMITYQDGLVDTITPVAFAAFNDCSIRKPNARKISEKKNWGACSKGLSGAWIDIEAFEANTPMDEYILSSQLKRNGEWLDYGIPSPVKHYGYFYGKLINWLKHQANTQEDTGPLENMREHLAMANYPATWIVALGATRYTELGQTAELHIGDVIRVSLSTENASCSTVFEQIIVE